MIVLNVIKSFDHLSRPDGTCPVCFAFLRFLRLSLLSMNETMSEIMETKYMKISIISHIAY